MAKNIEKTIFHYENPTLATAINGFSLAKEVSQHGTKVLIEGQEQTKYKAATKDNCYTLQTNQTFLRHKDTDRIFLYYASEKNLAIDRAVYRGPQT